MSAMYNRAMHAIACMLLVVVPAIGLADSSPVPPFAPGPYTPVTQDRLEYHADNWLMYRGDYAGWGFSPLKQINTDNVSRLKMAWSFSTGMVEGHEAPPIVNDGYMFVATPEDNVIALNARTGQQIWRYKYPVPAQLIQLHPTKRGVALWGDNVYLATLDCKLVSLDARTGKVNWIVTNGDWKALYYATLAPLAVKGKILMGCSGGETGVRGSVTAYDAQTGKRDWRFWTVPSPDQPGGNTWPGDAYKTGGGSIWVTGSYDPESNLTYWGTGNPAPWPADLRKGDNLYTDSVVALNVDTGELKGYFQFTPNEDWDWDEVSTPILITTELNGKETRTVVHASRSGFIYQLSNEPGKVLHFIKAWPFANNNTFASINPRTGRPTYVASRRPGPASYCPSAWGGKDWIPGAYSPDTKLLYVPANVAMCGYLPKPDVKPYKAGDIWLDYSIAGVLNSVTLPGNPSHIGELQAWDLSTHKMVWKHDFKSFLWAPQLATRGGLLFSGGTTDRMFHAYDARTGKMLWEYPAPSAIEGVPVSFELDGEQYIAVQAGWGVDGQRLTAQVAPKLGLPVDVPQGGVVMVFKLGRQM